ncbi:MAG: hypothetical protein OXG88_04280 [Gammaproteobacteria bacterium]|nr:hypothetical protein [Gammaproteobacteria bacterium]
METTRPRVALRCFFYVKTENPKYQLKQSLCLFGFTQRSIDEASSKVHVFANLAVARGRFAAVSVGAQDSDSDDENIEEMVVTGSRIVRIDLEGTSPVQIFEEEDILRSGVTSLGQLLREMPSVAGVVNIITRRDFKELQLNV